tara:strand:- start:493 stop:2061 length:1569 start_codon:yes stop_codon:yes gene_type:complete
MNCKISCSFGEVIDKITILRIKQSKTTQINILNNIENELNAIITDIPLCKTNDELFEELFNINNKLWELEDMIRFKSNNEIYDNTYIKCAEDIHKTNDERYKIKKKINDKYNSYIKEEKIYNENSYNKQDYNMLTLCKKSFSNGNYNDGLKYINILRDKYINSFAYKSFHIDIFFTGQCYDNILNIKSKYYYIIDNVINDIDKINITLNQIKYCKLIYTLHCLQTFQYKKCHNYLKYLNIFKGPNINPETMKFFMNNDVNKTLLLYDGGGIGDKLMLSRFIKKVSKIYKKNNIIFLVNDELCWLFEYIFKYNTNVKIISYHFKHLIKDFNYHCSLISLLYYLDYDYENIFFDPLLININNNSPPMIDYKKNTYIINWKGNIKNSHELHNRSIPIEKLVKLFKLSNINWIVITKEITKQELFILNKYNIQYYGDKIDIGKSFYDSINIFKQIDGVITTDTSIAHLSLNMNLNTYVLLSKGCDWRWGREDERTKWYPTANLIRQKVHGNWDNVVDRIYLMLKNK